MIIPEVVKQLQTGTVQNVVRYGAAKLPAPPYLVVRSEAQSTGRALRIIGHWLPDQQQWLEQYMFDELSDLLSDFVGKTEDGVQFRVQQTQEWTDIVTGNDDGTISMERVFLLPGLLF